MITNEQWEKYLVKYGGLLNTISRKINGDLALCGPDNYNDLCVAALESIRGFSKKTGKSFDEFIDDKLFDGYTKTVLWNSKNKKGSNIKKKFGFTNRIKSIEEYRTPDGEREQYDIEDKNSEKAVLVSDLINGIDPDVQRVIEAILKDPGVVTPDGFLKPHSLMKSLKISCDKALKLTNKLKEILKGKYNA